MITITSTNNKKVYFASDQHLGAPTQEASIPREKKFVAWLDEIKEDDIVKVEVTEMKQKGPYVMQCGSFKQKQQAEALKVKIAFECGA